MLGLLGGSADPTEPGRHMASPCPSSVQVATVQLCKFCVTCDKNQTRGRGMAAWSRSRSLTLTCPTRNIRLLHLLTPADSWDNGGRSTAFPPAHRMNLCATRQETACCLYRKKAEEKSTLPASLRSGNESSVEAGTSKPSQLPPLLHPSSKSQHPQNPSEPRHDGGHHVARPSPKSCAGA